MAARASSVKTALLLSTKDQEENCKKLRKVLESESEGYICVVDLVDVALSGLSLEEELRGHDCIVLICSPRATQLINDEESSSFVTTSGQEVNFDGKIISKVLQENDGKLRRKLIPVSFVELPSILHGAARNQEGRPSAISFEIKQGEVTELMLEGGVLESLIDAIANVRR